MPKLPHPPSVRTRLAAAVALALSAATARAADPAAAGSLWIGSQDAVRSAAAQVGVPLPPQFNVVTLEQMVPLFQPGDIRTDAPLGIFFVAADGDRQPDELYVLAVPVKAGAVPLAKVPDGTKTAAADTVGAGAGSFVRRTGDYVVTGHAEKVLTGLPVQALSDAMKPAADLARRPVLSAMFDLAAWKAAAPKQYDALMAQQDQQADAEADNGRRAGAKFAKQMYSQLERVSLAVDQLGPQGTGGWATTLDLRPFPTGHATFARPGLPADCAARADLQVPADTIKQMMASIPASSDKASADEIALGGKLMTAAFAGDAESFGVGLVNGKPVLYCVTQRAAPGDLAADMAAVTADAAKLPAAADPASYTPTTYKSAAGDTVYRLAGHHHGKANGYLDVTAHGNMRFTTLSMADAHLVDGLASLPPESDPLDTIGQGWVKPGPLVDVVSAVNDAAGDAANGLPADKRQQLKQLLGDARITFAAKPSGTGAAFTAQIPESILKAIRPAIELFH